MVCSFYSKQYYPQSTNFIYTEQEPCPALFVTIAGTSFLRREKIFHLCNCDLIFENENWTVHVYAVALERRFAVLRN
jgi:hypothetical protein